MAFQFRNARVFICLLRQYSVNHFSFQVCCRSRRQVSSPGEVLLGILWNSWWGCKSLPYFRPKIVIFYTCFQTRPLKSIPVSRPGLQAKIMSLLLRLERKPKNSSNPLILEFAYFSFFLLHLELKR